MHQIYEAANQVFDLESSIDDLENQVHDVDTSQSEEMSYLEQEVARTVAAVSHSENDVSWVTSQLKSMFKTTVELHFS